MRGRHISFLTFEVCLAAVWGHAPVCFSWWGRGFTALPQLAWLVTFSCEPQTDLCSLQQQQRQPKCPPWAPLFQLEKHLWCQKPSHYTLKCNVSASWIHFMWLNFFLTDDEVELIGYLKRPLTHMLFNRRSLGVSATKLRRLLADITHFILEARRPQNRQFYFKQACLERQQ